MIKIFYFLFIIFFLFNTSSASVKNKIIDNLREIKNISFDFRQKIEDEEETGKCIIEYPKKIYCLYNNIYNKILVSDGNSLVIKSNKNRQYYRYPLEKTPLNILLNKRLLMENIDKIDEKLLNKTHYVFPIKIDESLVNIFFDKEKYNFVGWQTEDIYQNRTATFIYNLEYNKNLEKKLFDLPKMH
tara:strand:- start:182 stop:739 length:558 start_codon:yes stop_codon:yes gene_type:complete